MCHHSLVTEVSLKYETGLDNLKEYRKSTNRKIGSVTPTPNWTWTASIGPVPVHLLHCTHDDVMKIEKFSALLALCAGNSPVSGEFPAQRPVTQSFDVFFDLRLNKKLGKQLWDWWYETPSSSLWRPCNVFQCQHTHMVKSSWHGNAFRITGCLAPVTKVFDLICFVINLDNLLDNHSSGRWCGTPRRCCDVIVIYHVSCILARVLTNVFFLHRSA